MSRLSIPSVARVHSRRLFAPLALVLTLSSELSAVRTLGGGLAPSPVAFLFPPTEARADGEPCDASAGTGARGTGGRGVVPVFDAGKSRVIGVLFPEEKVRPLGGNVEGWREVSTPRYGRVWMKHSDGAFGACARPSTLPFREDDRVLTCVDASGEEAFWMRGAPQRGHVLPSRVLGFADRTGVGSFRLIRSRTDGGTGEKTTTTASGEGRFSTASPDAAAASATLRGLVFERRGSSTHNIRLTLEGDGFKRSYESCRWHNPAAVLNLAGRFRIASCAAAGGEPTTLVLDRAPDGSARALRLQVGPLGERVNGDIRKVSTNPQGYLTVLRTEVTFAGGATGTVEIEVGRTDAEHRMTVSRDGFSEIFDDCLLENLFILQPAQEASTL